MKHLLLIVLTSLCASGCASLRGTTGPRPLNTLDIFPGLEHQLQLRAYAPTEIEPVLTVLRLRERTAAANTLSVAAHAFRTDQEVNRALSRALDECNRVNGELRAATNRIRNTTESDGIVIPTLPDGTLQTLTDRLRVALGVYHQSRSDLMASILSAIIVTSPAGPSSTPKPGHIEELRSVVRFDHTRSSSTPDPGPVVKAYRVLCDLQTDMQLNRALHDAERQLERALAELAPAIKSAREVMKTELDGILDEDANKMPGHVP